MSEALRNPTISDTRALVERIVSSSGFQKSPRLRELLEFIVASSLPDSTTPLTEQQIGTSIFHRPPQYDSSSDTIVRVQISQLRKRLEHYFLTEGRNERIVVEIPRGSYHAVFHARDLPLSQSAAPAWSRPMGSTQALERAFFGNRLAVFLLAAIAALGAASIFLSIRVWRADSAAAPTPAIRLLWSNLIKPSQKTSLVVADSGFGFLQDALGVPLDLDKYLQHDPRQWVEAGHPDPKLSSTLEMLAFRQYTSLGDLDVARRILLVNPALQSQISIVFARNYSARGPASDNVILLGSQRSNPWVQLYLDRVNFVFDYDEASRKATVRNRKPRQGESPIYTIAGDGHDIKDGYAVVSLLPNRTHSANILMMAGTDMEATEAVGVLTTSEPELAPVLAKIAANGHLPFFEALFKTRRLAGAPQECRLLAWRPIGN